MTYDIRHLCERTCQLLASVVMTKRCIKKLRIGPKWDWRPSEEDVGPPVAEDAPKDIVPDGAREHIRSIMQEQPAKPSLGER